MSNHKLDSVGQPLGLHQNLSGMQGAPVVGEHDPVWQIVEAQHEEWTGKFEVLDDTLPDPNAAIALLGPKKAAALFAFLGHEGLVTL